MNEVKVLPSDIWIEILRRFPAADLVPLKAVCKTFYALISDDLFVRLHLKHFTKHPKAATKLIIISTDPQKTPYQKTYDPDKRTVSVWYDEPRFDDWCSHVLSAYDTVRPKIHSHRVIDSHDGLLLVQICDRHLLCNPITRSYKFLPLIGRCSSNFCRCSSNSGCWKVAYDYVSEQYKVLGLRKSINRVLLYVFNVHVDEELHSPRETTTVILDDLVNECVLVNGNVYWLVTTNDESESECWGTCIVSVNVTTEEVKIRSCSSTPYLIMDINNVFAANGTFYQLGRCFRYNYELQPWVLAGVESENPNPSWMMKHRIDTHHAACNSTLSNCPYFMTRVLGMFHNKILIIITTKGDNPDQLYQYDLSREEFEEVTVARNGNNGVEMRRSESFRIVEHIDSLISLEPNE